MNNCYFPLKPQVTLLKIAIKTLILLSLSLSLETGGWPDGSSSLQCPKSCVPLAMGKGEPMALARIRSWRRSGARWHTVHGVTLSHDETQTTSMLCLWFTSPDILAWSQGGKGKEQRLGPSFSILNSWMERTGTGNSKEEQNAVIFGLLRNFHKENNFQLSKRQELKQEAWLHIRLLKTFTSQVIEFGLCPLETREMNQCLLPTTKGFAVFMPHWDIKN